MSNIKSQFGIVLAATTAIIFTVLVASSVIPTYAADGNLSGSASNNTSGSPLGGGNATNATSSTGSTTNSIGNSTSK